MECSLSTQGQADKVQPRRTEKHAPRRTEKHAPRRTEKHAPRRTDKDASRRTEDFDGIQAAPSSQRPKAVDDVSVMTTTLVHGTTTSTRTDGTPNGLPRASTGTFKYQENSQPTFDPTRRGLGINLNHRELELDKRLDDSLRSYGKTHTNHLRSLSRNHMVDKKSHPATTNPSSTSLQLDSSQSRSIVKRKRRFVNPATANPSSTSLQLGSSQSRSIVKRKRRFVNPATTNPSSASLQLGSSQSRSIVKRKRRFVNPILGNTLTRNQGLIHPDENGRVGDDGNASAKRRRRLVNPILGKMLTRNQGRILPDENGRVGDDGNASAPRRRRLVVGNMLTCIKGLILPGRSGQGQVGDTNASHSPKSPTDNAKSLAVGRYNYGDDDEEEEDSNKENGPVVEQAVPKARTPDHHDDEEEEDSNEENGSVVELTVPKARAPDHCEVYYGPLNCNEDDEEDENGSSQSQSSVHGKDDDEWNKESEYDFTNSPDDDGDGDESNKETQESNEQTKFDTTNSHTDEEFFGPVDDDDDDDDGNDKSNKENQETNEHTKYVTTNSPTDGDILGHATAGEAEEESNKEIQESNEQHTALGLVESCKKDRQGLFNIGNSCYINAAIQIFLGLVRYEWKELEDVGTLESSDGYHIKIFQEVTKVINELVRQTGSLNQGTAETKRTLVQLRSALFDNPDMQRELLMQQELLQAQAANETDSQFDSLDVLQEKAISSQYDSWHVLEAMLDAIYKTKLNDQLLSERLDIKKIGVATIMKCETCERSRHTENDNGSKKVTYSQIHEVDLPRTDEVKSFSDILAQSMRDERECLCPSHRCRGNQLHTCETRFVDLGKKVMFHVNRGSASWSAAGEHVRLKNRQRISLTGTLLLETEQSDNLEIVLEKQYCLRQVLLHIEAKPGCGHYICIKFDYGHWFLFDDNKKRQCLGQTVEELNAFLAKKRLFDAVHLLTYMETKSKRVGGCAPVSRNQLGWKPPRDNSTGTECLPDAVWNVMRELGYQVEPIDVRQGIKSDTNNLGYRDMPSAQEFLARQDPPLIVHRMFFQQNDQPSIFGLTQGNYLLEIRYWMEGENTSKNPRAGQIHYCAWLAERGILVDNTPGSSAMKVDRDQIPSRDYRKELFKKLWPATVLCTILSTHYVGKDDKEQIPQFVVEQRECKKESKRRRRQNLKKRKRRKLAAHCEK